MKAIAVRPPTPDSVHLRDIPVPTLADQPHPHVCTIPEGRSVLVRVLQIGVDATDREINEGKYGNAPKGCDYLILGHESFGRVVDVGSKVTEFQKGDLVSCTVRRPGKSLFDSIGRNDITSQDEYYERGINLCHGYLTEYFVDDAEYMVKVPPTLKHIGVLSEPASVCAKAIEQAYLAQTRLQVWNPKRAFVLGAGQIGLLATMMLRLKGLDVFTIARAPGPHRKSQIAEAYGATYISTQEQSMQELARKVGAPDLIFEATGSSQIAFQAMEVLGNNGVLIWTSVTGGQEQVLVPGDSINLKWVLGNKLLVASVNGNRKHFETGIKDLAHGEAQFPGVTEQILTHPLAGLDRFEEMMHLLVHEKNALKVFVNVSE
ncbi:MAG: theronine dehydrogenase-like Zn-dependent dehydrogenase [Planctomycetaceae bacterium]|nr:theronine dehydrogenase-like Zn-dependent dehydrogenase [Planctomycetaceae bacterium]